MQLGSMGSPQVRLPVRPRTGALGGIGGPDSISGLKNSPALTNLNSSSNSLGQCRLCKVQEQLRFDCYMYLSTRQAPQIPEPV